MRVRRIISLIATTCFAFGANSQVLIQRDQVIEKMVAEVSSDTLRTYITKLVSFGTRHTLSTTSDSRRGIGAAREWIMSKFRNFAASNRNLSVELDKWILPPDGRRIDVNADMGNAMAILRGTDTADKRIFIISGHMDSRVSDPLNRLSDAPGADDDGSGTAAVIECARVMSGHSFPATIIFVAFCGEEQSLFGGQHLAEKATQNNWDIEALLNNDIIGSNNSSETNIISNNQVRIFSEGLPAFDLEKKAAAIRFSGLENDGASRQLARYVKEMGERYIPNLDPVLIYRADRFQRGGDQVPFIQHGYAAIRITEMNENYTRQHQDIRTEKNIHYGDLPDYIDYEYLRKNAALNLATLANLAKSPYPPLEPKIELGQTSLGNFTSLRWKPPLEGKVKGYYVLMRETTSAQWQTKTFTADTEVRLPFSKDNYFFAVQSVSEEGNESLPVVPGMSR